MNAFAAYQQPSELARILSLPRRPAIDCSRLRGPDGKRQWSPEAIGLIQQVTSEYARPRITCACRDRYLRALHGGEVEVFSEPPPKEPPSPPLRARLADVFADAGHEIATPPNAETAAAWRAAREMEPGDGVTIPGLGHPRCIIRFNPVQAWWLRELSIAGGAFGMVSAGGGKSIMFIESPLAVKCRTAGLFIKPDQRLHYRNLYLRLREHFRVPSIVFEDGGAGPGSFIVSGAPVLRIIPYSVLSRTSSTALLDSYDFDAIFADEWHLLSNQKSSRTMRFLRAMTKPRIFGGASGSTIKKTIMDCAHLAAHSLGLGSPYPIPIKKNMRELDEFSKVIDPSPIPDRKSNTAMALVSAFGAPGTDVELFQSGFAGDCGIRQGFRDRVICTPGVVSTRSASVNCSIALHKWDSPPMPASVKDLLAKARQGIRPDKWEFDVDDAMEIAAMVRNVGCGYHFYWAFPRATDEDRAPGGTIDEWYARRKRWNKELRSKTAFGEVNLDSNKLCENAAERAWRRPPYDGPLPVWPASTWPEWAEIKDRVYYEERSKIFDDWLARGAAEWAREHVGIVWTGARAFGQKIAQLAGINYHGGGVDAEAKILAENGKRSIVASARSHGEARDGLQYRFHKQLLLEPFPSADRWEQFLARLAREGQEADTVETWVNLNISEMREAVRKAIMLAEYLEETTPNDQLLLAADRDFEL